MSLSARILQAQDEERRKISRELHDSVGQSLIAVLMNLELLSSTLTNKILEETITLVKDASRQVRTVSYLMHPPILELSGLEAAIRWFAEGFSRRSGINTQLDISRSLPRLSIEAETAFYRIVQECLTNIHRYAGASQAWIRIKVHESQLQLQVQDNGKGLAVRECHHGRNVDVSLGVGIPGMQERMRELGGILSVDSDRLGTKITATLFLTAQMRGSAGNSGPAGKADERPRIPTRCSKQR